MPNKKFYESIKKKSNQTEQSNDSSIITEVPDITKEFNEPNNFEPLKIPEFNLNTGDDESDFDINKIMFSPGELEEVSDAVNTLEKNKDESEFNREDGNKILGLFNKGLLLNTEDEEDDLKMKEMPNDAYVAQKRGPKPADRKSVV